MGYNRPSKPIISLKEADLTETVADSNTNRAFYMTAYYDVSGILRINDLNSAKDDELTELTRLYNYAFGTVGTSQAEVASKSAQRTYYEKLYDLVQKSNILECGHTEDECLADSTLCRNCYINRYKSDGTKQWKFIFGDQGTSVGSYNYINGQLTIVTEDGSNAIFAKTEFYDNGKIKQLGKYEQRYDETIGRNRNTLVSYSYDEDGNMTGCSIRNVSATIETCGCSEYIYQCPKN